MIVWSVRLSAQQTANLQIYDVFRRYENRLLRHPLSSPPFPFRHIFSLHLLVYFINYFIFAIQPRKYHSKTHVTMETKTNALDPQRSLELIADMVANSRRRLERHIGTPLLV